MVGGLGCRGRSLLRELNAGELDQREPGVARAAHPAHGVVRPYQQGLGFVQIPCFETDAACRIAKSPTARPTSTPVSIAERKWKPTSTRDSAFSSSARVKEGQHRCVSDGVEVVEIMQNGNAFVPVNWRTTSAAAPPRRLWVDG